MRERSGSVVEAREVAPRVTLVAIEPDEPVVAKAGQFLSLRLPNGERRSYSVVSSSGETSRLELMLKSTVAGGGTDTIADALATGSRVHFFGPMGFFLYRHGHRGDVLFGATGIGITAIAPMVEEALRDPAGPASVTLLWGLRDPADQVLGDRLSALESDARFRQRILYSGQGDGHITPHVIAFESDDPRFYLCGQGQMVAAVRAARPDAPIHTEVFYPS